MTAPSREDAVRAVAEALATARCEAHGNWGNPNLPTPCDACRSGMLLVASPALDALTPYIAAAVAADREALAEAMEAERRMHSWIVADTADAPATNNRIQRARDHGIQLAYANALDVIRSAPPWGTVEGGAP